MKRQKLLLLPGLLWLVLFLIVPLLFVVWTSFLSRDVYGSTVNVWTLDNYRRFFEPLYLSIFWDTIVLSAATTLLCLAIGYPLAYAVTMMKPRWQKVLLILIMVPFWINFLIRSYAWILLLRNQGIVNTALQALGWIDRPLSMLYTTGAVLLGMVYTLLPFMVLPIYVSLEKMDRKLHEAAADLGATPLKSFWHITVPQTLSGVIAGCLVVFVSTMCLYVVPDVMGGAKSAMYGNVIQNQFLAARDWPFGSALSVIFIVFSLAFIAVYQRATRRNARRDGA
jgi:spermidine/putrescine transport system permease protein